MSTAIPASALPSSAHLPAAHLACTTLHAARAQLESLPISSRCAQAAELLRVAAAHERTALVDAIRPCLHGQALDMLLDQLQPLAGLPAALSVRSSPQRVLRN